MKKRRTITTVSLFFFAALLFLTGAAILAKPTVNRLSQNAQAEQAVASFFQEHGYEAVPQAVPEGEASELPVVIERKKVKSAEPTPYPELLEAMREYNDQIYRNKQCGLADPWAYTASVIDLADYGLEGEAVGVLTIPRMEYEEPVYLGATYSHLDQGAAQLSISSMPIGGENTNCVLAAHRGWVGAEHMKNIERLEIGDTVVLTNLWEVLEYEVAEIKIIEPYQPEELLIQKGRDLLTIVTCHPYGSGGRYRYVVYCERKSKKEV